MFYWERRRGREKERKKGRGREGGKEGERGRETGKWRTEIGRAHV